MLPKNVRTSNQRQLHAAHDEVVARSSGLPGLIVVWGETGIGKSYGALSLVERYGAIYVAAFSGWTLLWMHQDISREMGLPERGRSKPMVRNIIESLRASGRSLIIDEADYLSQAPKLLEGICDIANASSSTIILIGMKRFRASLINFPQICGRVARWVEFRDASLDDALQVAAETSEVAIADDLVARLFSQTGGSMRRLALGLHQIELAARRRRIARMTLADWGDRWFDFADAPLPRRKIVEASEAAPRLSAVA